MKLLLLFSLLFYSITPNTSFTFITTVMAEYDFYASDSFENIYLIKGQQIEKYSNQGKKLKSYSNNYLGNISCTDASDPFRILLFYKDFNQLLFLDNNLAEIRSPISLDDLEINDAELVCSSNLGGFWVYDNTNTQVLYFNNALQKTAQSIRISSIAEFTTPPNKLIEKNDFIYLNFPDEGVLVFDKFGAYYKKIPIKVESFQVVEEKSIIYLQNTQAVKYNHELFTSSNLALPDSTDVTDIHISGKKLFLFKKGAFDIYQINK